jgi:hypothetical protein
MLHSNEKNVGQDKAQAVEAYKRAIELVKGETNKQNIALTLQSLLTQLNREFEINPYKQYLPEMAADDFE